jgi:hypothetical protein
MFKRSDSDFDIFLPKYISGDFGDLIYVSLPILFDGKKLVR